MKLTSLLESENIVIAWRFAGKQLLSLTAVNRAKSSALLMVWSPSMEPEDMWPFLVTTAMAATCLPLIHLADRSTPSLFDGVNLAAWAGGCVTSHLPESCLSVKRVMPVRMMSLS